MTRDADVLRTLAEDLNVVRALKEHGVEPAALKAMLLRAARAADRDEEECEDGFAAPDECEHIEMDRPAPAAGTEFIVHTDGASRGNPGPAAAGFAIYAGNKLIEAAGQYLGRRTSNQAEYNALILGLARARQLGAERVIARCDSELMVRQIKGHYRVKNEQLKPLFDRARQEIAGFTSFAIEHVPREQNMHADRMANRALDEFES